MCFDDTIPVHLVLVPFWHTVCGSGGRYIIIRGSPFVDVQSTGHSSYPGMQFSSRTAYGICPFSLSMRVLKLQNREGKIFQEFSFALTVDLGGFETFQKL